MRSGNLALRVAECLRTSEDFIIRVEIRSHRGKHLRLMLEGNPGVIKPVL